jgi:hypothetical protein
MTKKRTIQQVETAKKRAVRFLQNVLDEPERADQVAQESVEDYADRRKIQIVSNPAHLTRTQQGRDVLEVVAHFPQRKRPDMAKATKSELQETVNDVADKVSEMLDPELSREDMVRKAKELDELVNGSDDDDDDDSDDDDDDDSDDDDDDDYSGDVEQAVSNPPQVVVKVVRPRRRKR